MNTSTSPRVPMPRAWESSAWFWWLLVAAYYTVGCLTHLKVSLWLVRQRDTILGTHALSELMPLVALAAGLALIISIVRQLRRSPHPRSTGGYWLLWLAGVVLFDLFLTFSINEYAHYPQYALLAWLLARALDPRRTRRCVGRVLFWTTLLGAGDELLQYLWITASYSDYFDFNDVLVNLLSAAAGVLLYYGAVRVAPKGAPRDRPVAEVLVATVLALGLSILLSAGIVIQSPPSSIPKGGLTPQADGSSRLYLQRGPGFYGSWQSGPRHGKYYVLPPGAGLGGVLVVGTIFLGFGLFRPVACKQEIDDEVSVTALSSPRHL